MRPLGAGALCHAKSDCDGDSRKFRECCRPPLPQAASPAVHSSVGELLLVLGVAHCDVFL